MAILCSGAGDRINKVVVIRGNHEPPLCFYHPAWSSKWGRLVSVAWETSFSPMEISSTVLLRQLYVTYKNLSYREEPL